MASVASSRERPAGWQVSTGRVLQGILLIAGFVSLLAFLPFDWWLIDLFAHFRWQYFLVFAGAAFSLAALHSWKSATAATLLACLNLVEVAPRYISDSIPPTATSAGSASGIALRLMTFNVNSQGDPQKALQVINAANPDILLLLEVNPRWMQMLEPLNARLPYQIAQPRRDNFGLVLYRRFALVGQIHDLGSARIPAVYASIELAGKRKRSHVGFWGIHPPPPMGPSMSAWRDEVLAELVPCLQGQRLSIVAGDFNTTPYAMSFKSFKSATDLLDSGRGYGLFGTWPMNSRWLSIPIDHVLHTEDIVVRDHRVWWGTGSDHGALVVDLVVPAVKPSGLGADGAR